MASSLCSDLKHNSGEWLKLSLPALLYTIQNNALFLGLANLEAAVAQVTAGGMRVLGDGKPRIGAHGKPVVFLHPKDACGTLIELEQV